MDKPLKTLAAPRKSQSKTDGYSVIFSLREGVWGNGWLVLVFPNLTKEHYYIKVSIFRDFTALTLLTNEIFRLTFGELRSDSELSEPRIDPLL